jgi:hypothetical protein
MGTAISEIDHNNPNCLAIPVTDAELRSEIAALEEIERDFGSTARCRQVLRYARALRDERAARSIAPGSQTAASPSPEDRR